MRVLVVVCWPIHCVEFAVEAGFAHRVGGVGADPLVSERRQVEVVGGLANGASESDQFVAVGTGLAVVFGQVSGQFHG